MEVSFPDERVGNGDSLSGLRIFSVSETKHGSKTTMSWLPSNVFNLYTDAAGGFGFGNIFGNFWYYGPWPDEALVKSINRTTSQDPIVMILVRQLVLAYLKLNILFWAKHVPGAKNTLADALSRLQVSKFCKLAPAGVQIYPSVIPTQLLPHNWQI